MPIHEWTRVDAGTFHAFDTAWVTHLSETMNDGPLPSGYYAMPEQHVGRSIADVLTLIERNLLPDRPVFFITAGRRGGGKTAHPPTRPLPRSDAATCATAAHTRDRRRGM